MATRLNGDMLQHTRALEATMASNSDPKFKNSKFLQFLSKMSNGEVILEDNQVCPSALPVTVDSLTSTHRTIYCHSVWYLHMLPAMLPATGGTVVTHRSTVCCT